MTLFQPQLGSFSKPTAGSDVRFGDVFRIRSKSGNEKTAMTEAKLKADWEQLFAAAESGFTDRFERDRTDNDSIDFQDESQAPLLLTDVIARLPELLDKEAELLSIFEKIKSGELDAKKAQAQIDTLLDDVLLEEEAMQETFDHLSADTKEVVLASTDYQDADVDDVNVFGVFKDIREKGAKAVKMLGDWYVLTKDDLVRYILEAETEQSSLKNLMEQTPHSDDSDVVLSNELQRLKQELAKKADVIDVA